MHPFFDVPRPCAIGHRGAAGELPENTLSSFGRALARGAAILECDLRASSDGVPIIFHDPVLDRTTDGSGPPEQQPIAVLRRLDAAHRFSAGEAGRTPLRGRGFRIPTFEEALKTFPEAHFNLELKTDDPTLRRETLRIVGDLQRARQVLLTAENAENLHKLRAAAAAVRLPVAFGAAAAEVGGFVQSALAGCAPPPGPMALQVPSHFLGSPLVTQPFVEHAHRHGLQVHVWTVNDPAAIHQLLDLGVDGVVSDFPGRVVEVIETRRRGG